VNISDSKEYINQYQRSRRAKAKSQGICGTCCSRPARQGLTTCRICGERAKQYCAKSRDNYRNTVLPPQPITCPICGSIPAEFFWHHWNDEIREFGMWICPFCNIIVELEDRGLVDKYRELKRNATHDCGVRMLDRLGA